jgi:hypothetical protein
MNTNQVPHLSCVWSNPVDWDSLNVNTDVPAEPGYYAFTDHADALQPTAAGKSVLYVGIATQSIRDRIRKYKTGDKSGTKGLMNLHAGGFFMMLGTRGATAHYDGKSVTHSVQRNPVEVYIKATATKPAQHYSQLPDAIYLRWAVDYRAAIEALLIQQLYPKFNSMLVQD